MRSPIGVPGPISVKILLSSRDVAISGYLLGKALILLLMRRILVGVNPDLVILDMRRPHAYRLGTGREGGLAGADQEPPLVKRAFDLLADDRALAERARPVTALVGADEILIAELVDGKG